MGNIWAKEIRGKEGTDKIRKKMKDKDNWSWVNVWMGEWVNEWRHQESRGDRKGGLNKKALINRKSLERNNRLKHTR